MKNIIFIDIDGTLMLESQIVPESAKNALKLAKTKGADIFIATGRAIQEVGNDILDLGFDGFITGGGSDILFKGAVIKQERFLSIDAKEILDYFDCHGISYYVGTGLGLSTPKHCIRKFVEIWNMNSKVVSGFPREFYEALTFYEFNEVSINDINKISFASKGVPFSKVYNKFSNRYEVLHKTVYEFGDFSGEIVLKHADKGAAVRAVIERYSEPITTYAFGDGSNDKTMLMSVDHSVRMHTSHEDLYTISRHVAPPIVEDGLLKIFKKLNLV